MGIQGPPGFLSERLSLSLFLLSNCGLKNSGVWDVRMQSIPSCTCPEIESVVLKGQELKGENSPIGSCLWTFRICHSRPLKKCCRPKAEACCNPSPEELRVADASQLLVCLIHKKSPFLTALYFLQVPGLYRPEQHAALLARG